jgi:hypothetical protein
MADTATVIRRFPITSGSWTAIVTPVPCSYYMIFAEGGNGMKRASDPNNASAQYTMPTGTGYAVDAARRAGPRFNAGDTVTWVQAVSTSDTCIAEFIY